MKTDSAGKMSVQQAALAYDAGMAAASRQISARARRRPSLSVPLAVGAAAIALLILPKSLRKTVFAAAFPLVATWARDLFR